MTDSANTGTSGELDSKTTKSPVSQGSHIIRFGVFDVDLLAGELRKAGVKIRLQDQPFQILVMLLERQSEVVTRQELREKLWPADTFVDFEHGVNSAVARLREALGDSPKARGTSKRYRGGDIGSSLLWMAHGRRPPQKRMAMKTVS